MIFNKTELSFSGIYKITNIKNGKFYIGSSINFYRRFHGHLHNLRNNKHGNLHLQRSFNKYGEDNFEFRVIFKCDIKDLIKFEQEFLDKLKPSYNIRKIADNNTGIKKSEESKRKQSLAIKGRKQSQIHILNRINSREGFKHSEKTRNKWSLKRKGVKRTKESIEKQILKRVKPILQYDLDGNFIKKWNSVKEAKDFYKDTNISQYCLKNKKDRRGFLWRYEKKIKSKYDGFSIPTPIKFELNEFTETNNRGEEVKKD